MRLVTPVREPKQTPESIFAEKYPWLLRWAMHFSHNDRAVAEDLVQDAFVRMLLSWDKLHSLHDLEPLLYSYLRYAHLTDLRKGNSYVFQSLSTVDSDTLAISLRISNSFDQIEVQNELRSILYYLLWRKESAKFASIFLLRFFHGFYPEEIATICVATRHSIDLSLRHARAEVKSYLLDPHSIQISNKRRLPDLQQPNIAVPADEFVHELRREMFKGVRASCPSQAELERNYRSAYLRSLDCAFLAHVVACEPCLEKITRICGAPPPSARSMEDSLATASRTKQSKKNSPSEKATVAKTIAEGRRRLREILEHYPTGLVIALNGEAFAVRDVSSRRAFLKVETHTMDKLELVEVFSEQRMLLLALPIAGSPPFVAPQIQHQVCLSFDRNLTVQVNFNRDGVTVEAIYEDPHFTSEELSPEQAGLSLLRSRKDNLAEMHLDAPKEPAEHDTLRQRGWRRLLGQRLLGQRLLGQRLLGWMRQRPAARSIWSRPAWFRPLVCVSACAFAALGSAAWIHNDQAKKQVEFRSSLEQSLRAEQRAPFDLKHIAVHRTLEIHAAGKVVERDLYLDSEGHRRARQHATDKDEQTLRLMLAQAGIDWNDPLTAASFKRWRDNSGRDINDSRQVHGNLIVLTSSVASGPVRLESLTVRSSDFHTVARKVLLEDGGDIEIAEVSLDVVPWERVNPDWFEPVSSAISPASIPEHAALGLAAPTPLTDGEIDLASLGVLEVLEEMHADTERLEMKRSRNGVQVTGIVESDARKQQLQARLIAIPHVKPEIFSYREMEARSSAATTAQELKAVSVSSTDSQLDLHCRSQSIAREQCRRWSYQLLDSDTVLTRSSSKLAHLQAEYPEGKSLTPGSKLILATLVAGHLDHLKAALWDQQQTLQKLQLWSETDAGNGETGRPPLTAAIARNKACIHELVYASYEGARPAAAIARDLAQSIGEAQKALSHMPTNAADNSASSSGTSTPQER